MLGNAVSGSLITETCSLVQSDGGLWTYPNQTSAYPHRLEIYKPDQLTPFPAVIVANSTTVPFSSQGSGIFGLGATSHSGRLGDTVVGNWLAQHPEASNFTYGMALRSPQDSGNAGVIHWLAPDQSAYTGPVTWVLSQTPADNASSSELAVRITEWRLSTTGISNSNSRGAVGVIDPFRPEIRVPQAAARELCPYHSSYTVSPAMF